MWDPVFVVVSEHEVLPVVHALVVFYARLMEAGKRAKLDILLATGLLRACDDDWMIPGLALGLAFTGQITVNDGLGRRWRWGQVENLAGLDILELVQPIAGQRPGINSPGTSELRGCR